MTKKEALQILAVLKAAYPASYNGMTQEEASGTVAVWAMQFANMPVEIVMMAIHKLIATNKFPPTVSEVKDKIKSIHWEAYDFACSAHGQTLPESVRMNYKRIYEATMDYKYGQTYEPKIGQIMDVNKPLQIGGGNNGV